MVLFREMCTSSVVVGFSREHVVTARRVTEGIRGIRVQYEPLPSELDICTQHLKITGTRGGGANKD